MLNRPIFKIVAGTATVLLLTVFFSEVQTWWLVQKTQKLQNQFNQIQKPLAELQTKLMSMQSYANARGMISSAGLSLEQYQQILSQFNEFPGITLEQMEYRSDLKKINWTGTASNPQRLTQYSQKLKVYFSKINLLSSQNDGKVTRFKLEASL